MHKIILVEGICLPYYGNALPLWPTNCCLDFPCLVATGEDIEGGDGEVSEEEAAALRAQMEELLRQPTAPGSPDDADAQYGRDMWARCEALTAGVLLRHALCPKPALVKSAHYVITGVPVLRGRP
jgi:hypothetical protein